MRGAADRCGGETRECGRLADGLTSRVVGQLGAMVHRTPRRVLGESALPAETGPQIGWPALVLSCGSRTTAKFGPCARSIREKIIGRSMCGLTSCVEGRRPLVFGCRALAGLARRGGVLALLHQPARQHGRGVFFQPGIQQLSDLLAEIGRVTQAGKLVTLQGIARRRMQELPRRLGFVIQGDLQGKRLHSKRIVNTVNGTAVLISCGKLCKSSAWSSKHGGFAHVGAV